MKVPWDTPKMQEFLSRHNRSLPSAPTTDPETVIINGKKYGIMVVSEPKNLQDPDWIEARLQIPNPAMKEWRVLFCMEVE